MGIDQLAPGRAKVYESPGRIRQRCRATGPRVLRYRSPVSEARLTFGDVLEASIDRWYESDSDFARRAEVSSSAVSRWRSGIQVPKPNTIRQLAPFMKDSRGKPYTAGWLLSIAYPDVLGTRGEQATVAPAMHPLAREVMRLLADDSPMPADERDVFANLLDHLVRPYRHFLRRRKAG